MKSEIDYNALLLKILAHDLMAPLTAIKWQSELLASGGHDKEKQDRYLRGVRDATELGITIARHAHVAGQVLTGTYEGMFESTVFSDTINEAVRDLKLQFERHALLLDAVIEETKGVHDFDISLLRLYVWSIAKFFLAAMPPHTSVQVRGAAREGGAEKGYTLTMSASGILQAEKLVRAFKLEEMDGNLDQKFVFAKLIHEIAPYLASEADAQTEDGVFSITAVFMQPCA